MNEKANVTKDLNAKHAKILEGLVRLPENKECADCSNKAPRWASVNIGAFICMQCSGIHRSLGVHISKVRSTTLDTWLPEQVAFMQRVGNKKSNSYWEAELPPDYNRKPIETFIRAKYVEKTWVDKNGVQPCPDHYETPNRLSDAGLVEHPPRKERRLSLEEEILTKHLAQAQLAPPRQRGCSLDLKEPKVAPNPNGGRPPTGDNLLCTPNSKQECCTTTPSNWQTFESSLQSRFCIYKQTKISCFLPILPFSNSISRLSVSPPLQYNDLILVNTAVAAAAASASASAPEYTSEDVKMEGEKVAVQSSEQSSSLPSQCPTAAMPTWLMSSIADLTEKMKTLEVNNNNHLEEHDSDDTFAQRAESYYQKQPKLLSLLNDLYNAYISLSDSYLHALTKNKHGSNKRQSSKGDSMDEIDSDTESSLSYQRLISMTPNCFPGEDLVVEFVMKSAERDLMLHELGIMERCCGESSRKIGIQSSLLEVMEAERSFLLSENKTLGHKLAVLEEENRELLSESNVIRNKATELARCVLEMKEEESVGRLLRTIEDLQDRVQGLEEKNMEYCKVIIGSGNEEEGIFGGGCFQMEKLKKKWKVNKVKVTRKGKKGRKVKRSASEEGGGVGGRWWRKVKNLGIFKRVGRRL